MLLDDKWMHVACQGKEVCNVLAPVEDIIGRQSRSQ